MQITFQGAVVNVRGFISLQSNASRTSNRNQFFALHTGVEQEKKAIEACKQCLGVALTDERAEKGAEKNKDLAVKLLSASQE